LVEAVAFVITLPNIFLNSMEMATKLLDTIYKYKQMTENKLEGRQA